MKRAEGKSKIARSVVLISLLFLLSLLVALPPMLHAQTKIRMQSAFPAKGTFADNAVFLRNG